MLFHDPYETYKAYETKGKDYGDIQQVSKEYENEAFVSFTYPAYEEKELNSLVKAYEKKTVPAAGKTKKQITSIDYDSSLLFDLSLIHIYPTIVDAKRGTGFSKRKVGRSRSHKIKSLVGADEATG